jgi:Na+(H+)/acetate symporter ActP
MSDQAISIVFFIGIIALTLGITAWASRQNTGTDSHYVAGGQIKGWQNGLAISATTSRRRPSSASRGPSPSAASRASTSR